MNAEALWGGSRANSRSAGHADHLLRRGREPSKLRRMSAAWCRRSSARFASGSSSRLQRVGNASERLSLDAAARRIIPTSCATSSTRSLGVAASKSSRVSGTHCPQSRLNLPRLVNRPRAERPPLVRVPSAFILEPPRRLAAPRGRSRRGRPNSADGDVLASAPPRAHRAAQSPRTNRAARAPEREAGAARPASPATRARRVRYTAPPMRFPFHVSAVDPEFTSSPRRARPPHGRIETPVFARRDGTRAAVRDLDAGRCARSAPRSSSATPIC